MSDSDILSDAERARIAGNIEQIKLSVPGFIPFFKEAHQLFGLNGWRDIDYVGPPREGPPGLTVNQLVLESAADLKARMKNGHH